MQNDANNIRELLKAFEIANMQLVLNMEKRSIESKEKNEADSLLNKI